MDLHLTACRSISHFLQIILQLKQGEFNMTLNTQEQQIVVDELSTIMANTIDEVIKYADSYKMHRDDALRYFATALSAIVATSSFQHYEGKDS